MENSQSRYEGRLVRLGPIDHAKDPPIACRWTLDPQWRSLFAGVPAIARPLSPQAVSRILGNIEKEMEEKKKLFHFTIRLIENDRLLGLAYIHRIDFHHGTGVINLGIGNPSDRRRGYGSDALDLLLTFAFDELNLHRLSAWAVEDNLPFLRMVDKAGFKEEARRREAGFHSGRYWDAVFLGLLKTERKPQL